MKVIKRIKDLRKEIAGLKSGSRSVGLVPTMGALHAGHASLIRRSHKENDCTVASIFVNPAQFGPKEDFKQYPRDLKGDIRLCKEEGADIVFCPQVKEIYPSGYRTYAEVSGLSNTLCGKSRPRHFRGVATIVAKLFNMTGADRAYFGQKDAQQAVIIRKLADDLNIPVEVKVMPIVRHKDGLAMSSRNIYLNKKEREEAVVLYQSLIAAKNLIKSGVRDSGKIIRTIKGMIKNKKSAKIDYVAIVDLDNLRPLKKISGRCLIALAVRVGKTRLIDNLIVKWPG